MTGLAPCDAKGLQWWQQYAWGLYSVYIRDCRGWPTSSLALTWVAWLHSSVDQILVIVVGAVAAVFNTAAVVILIVACMIAGRPV
jgi:hypothetical protein